MPLQSANATVINSVTFSHHWAWRRHIHNGPDTEALVEIESIIHELDFLMGQTDEPTPLMILDYTQLVGFVVSSI